MAFSPSKTNCKSHAISTRWAWTSSKAAGPAPIPRTPSSSSAHALDHARITAFSSTRKAGVAVEDDAIVQALLDSEAEVVTLVGKSSELHVTGVLGATLEENLDMIADTVAYLKAKGRTGADAVVRVLVDSTDGERRWSTVGSSTNIIDASWMALADSMEYWLTKYVPR